MNKLEELKKWSNPEEVIKRGKKYNMNIEISNRKDKKYMLLHNGKYIHFGQMNYKDFTLTNDENKRRLFKLRNARWANADKYSAAFLSYNLLW
jgi:hypothetical protein